MNLRSWIYKIQTSKIYLSYFHEDLMKDFMLSVDRSIRLYLRHNGGIVM